MASQKSVQWAWVHIHLLHLFPWEMVVAGHCFALLWWTHGRLLRSGFDGSKEEGFYRLSSHRVCDIAAVQGNTSKRNARAIQGNTWQKTLEGASWIHPQSAKPTLFRSLALETNCNQTFCKWRDLFFTFYKQQEVNIQTVIPQQWF